jgi:ribonuclease VapC
MEEAGHDELISKLYGAPVVVICTATLFETELVMARKLKEIGHRLVAEFLKTFGVQQMSFGERQCRSAIVAYWVYGKGRAPARLNFGDCMSYATARVLGWPLLYVGDDFGRTDIEAA